MTDKSARARALLADWCERPENGMTTLADILRDGVAVSGAWIISASEALAVIERAEEAGIEQAALWLDSRVAESRNVIAEEILKEAARDLRRHLVQEGRRIVPNWPDDFRISTEGEPLVTVEIDMCPRPNRSRVRENVQHIIPPECVSKRARRRKRGRAHGQ